MEPYLNSPEINGLENEPIIVYISNPNQEQINGDVQIAARPPKNPRALAYDFFDWEEDIGRHKCKICGKKYAVPISGGTGSLHNHMKRDHKSIFESAKIAKTAKNGNGIPSLSTCDIQKAFNPSMITNDIFRHKLAKFIVCCDEPFTLTENEYFRDLINYVSGGNDECKLFCAKTTKGLITGLYEQYKSEMKATLQNNEGKISFVIDCWTSSNQHPFQGVIARWINNDWELCSTVLDLTILKGSHDGPNIAAAFWDVLKDYNLISKVLSVTTDNASNMDTMFEELEKLFLDAGIIFDSKNFRLRCFAHIMNLACQAIIRSVGDGTKEEYPSDGESDVEEEHAKAKVLPVVAKMRKGVVAIRNSPQRREVLARQCVAAKIEPKVVLRDVRTRWNATHTMMERANDLKEPFDLTLTSIPKLRKYVLDEGEWNKIQELLELLAPFKEATEMLSNEHSPTVSRVSSVYQVLFDHLEKFKTKDRELSEPSSKRVKRNIPGVAAKPSWLIQAAERGLEKLEKYYPTTDGLVYIVNTVLDPRCKLVWFKATGWPKEWIDYSRKSVNDLFKSKYKPKDGTSCENIEAQMVKESKNHLFKDLFIKQMKNFQKASSDDELKTYLSESVVDPELLEKEKSGIDGVLGWWKVHQKEFPNLAKMAKDFLPAAGTGVPVERLFSSGPDVISNKQQRMAPETIQMRICLKAWLKSRNSFNDDIIKAIAHKLGADGTEQFDKITVSH